MTGPSPVPIAVPAPAGPLSAGNAATAEEAPRSRYRVEHTTRYDYAAPVVQSWQLARLTPRMLPWQQVLTHALQIDPPPDERHDTTDVFGNTVAHFALHRAHRRLRVSMQCTAEIGARPVLPSVDEPWERVRDAMRLCMPPCDLAAARMVEPTQLVPLSHAARDYAATHFTPGRDWTQAVGALMRAIHRDFEFDPDATTVATSVDEVLQQRRGVCQDFSHLMLASLRAYGLAARYVSGYLLTDPPPGQTRLMGADASHAWVAAYAPQCGWVEFDPTNCQLADARYITLAWGADFADVVPLRGVILGGGEQTLDVSVSVMPA